MASADLFEMPPPEPTPHAGNGGPTTSADALDDLFDYDAGMDAMFRDVDTNMDAPARPNTKDNVTGATGKTGADGLGIDEEIQVTKTRRVTVKLDEERLLSQAGIPKLRRISKERLRFKGKGHEFSDVGRLLSFYQLWLDDLYPKAKFADALSIIEKLGHSRRMQVMRKEWIDEDKPGYQPNHGHEFPQMNLDAVVVTRGPTTAGAEAVQNSLGDSTRPHTPPPNSLEDGDLYNATPVAVRTKEPEQDGADELPEDDELDALLAEDTDLAAPRNQRSPGIEGDDRPSSPPRSRPPVEDNFDDEMEAMAEMGAW